MPERANSFPRVFSGLAFILSAMFAVFFQSPVRADSACTEQPGPLVEGTRWILRDDHAKGRECWILVDALGHETGLWGGPVTLPQTQSSAASAPALPSQHGSSLGASGFTEASANVTTERGAPQVVHPKPLHKPHGNIASANRADDGFRADQKIHGKGHAVKRVSSVLISREESAKFEEFLQWRERQQQFADFLRWRELQRLTGGMK